MTEQDNNATEREREIEARCEAATPSPWNDRVTDEGDLVVDFNAVPPECGYADIIVFGDMEMTARKDHLNAAFIAHARSDVPYLLEQNRTLRKVLSGLVALIDDDRRSCCTAPFPEHTPDCPWLVAKRLVEGG